jgi:hypothetical protein
MRFLVVLLALATTARADPDGIHAAAEQDAPPPGDLADPFTHLDAHLRLTIDDLGSKIAHFERGYQLGRRGRVRLTTDWRVVDHDIPVRGWRAAVDGAYDLGGGFTIATHAGVEHVDTDLGRDSLMTAGVSLGTSFRLGRSARAWIGLTLGHRRWLEPPPTGEENSTQVMLSAKVTY